MIDAEFRELEAAIAVARHGGFRHAARALGCSASAVSHAVARLEARLGVRLFQRTTRSVSLSEAGRRFVSRIRPAIEEIAEAVSESASSQTTPSGTLRINASRAALRFVVPRLAAFLAAHPAMRLDLVSDDALVDIVARGFDAGIRLAEMVPEDMVAVPCSPDIGFVVVACPDYLRDRRAPEAPADLAAHECVRRRLADGRPYAWEFERAGRELRIEVDGRLAADDELAMLEAARAGLGLAYLRSWTAAPDLASGRLVQVLADWTPPHPGFRLYYPARRHVPAGLRALAGLFRSSDRIRSPARVPGSAVDAG